MTEPAKQKYFKTPAEAEKAAQADYYRSGIHHGGRIGGPECPVEYGGDGRPVLTRVPEGQRSQ